MKCTSLQPAISSFNQRDLNRKKNPNNLEEAYKLQSEVKYLNIGAWKLGGSTKPTREAFNVSSIYAGPIEKSEIFYADNNEINTKSKIGEIEIAVLLSQKVSQLKYFDESYIRSNIEVFIKSHYCAVEFPYTTFNFPEDGVNALILDCCAAGSLLIGQEIDKKLINRDIKISIVNNDINILNGSNKTLVASLNDILFEFLLLAKKLNFDIKPGQFVSTGGLSDCIPLPLNKDLTIKHNNEPDKTKSFKIIKK